MKTERIYRELLLRSLSKDLVIPQVELASRCQVSLGLVNKTAKRLEAARAVEITRQGVRILFPARILNLWATERRLSKDVIAAFRLEPLERVERELPRTSILTAFSAWRALTGRLPAEYFRIYFYIEEDEEFGRWLKFREARIRKTNPNVFVLQSNDPHLLSASRKGIAPVPQIYVDIYSAGGPEAAPFLRDIAETHPELSLW